MAKPFSHSDEAGRKRTGISIQLNDQQWSSIMSRMLSLVLRYYVQAILGAALLVSPGAHASQSRGLSLATAEATSPNEVRQQAPETQQTPVGKACDTQPQTPTLALT